jgi:cell division GTPase FtsZ
VKNARKSSASSKSSSSRKRTTAKRGTAKRSTARKRSTSRARSTQSPSQAKQKQSPQVSSASQAGPKGASRELVPTLALEEYSPQEAPSKGAKDTNRGSTKFGWIGTGQCGGRLVKAFSELGYAKTLAMNTAYHDLDELRLPQNQKILMDIGRKGAGKDMSRGQQAAIQYRQEIIHSVEQTFSDNVDHIMLALGCGGGTGSGSVLPLIDTIRTCAKHIGLRNPERRIGVLCTLPTDGEAASPKVGRNAYESLQELTRMAMNGEISPLIIVDNEKISRMYPGLTVREFWPTINTTVAGLFDIFNRLSALSSPYTAFDSVDYQSIMQSAGCMIMGLTKVDYFQRRYDISEAMKNNLSKTLLAGGFNLDTARVAGSVVVGGKKIMANTPGLQDSINHAFDVLTDVTGQATVHRGIYEDQKDSLRVYTIIGGLDAPTERMEELLRVS